MIGGLLLAACGAQGSAQKPGPNAQATLAARAFPTVATVHPPPNITIGPSGNFEGVKVTYLVYGNGITRARVAFTHNAADQAHMDVDLPWKHTEVLYSMTALPSLEAQAIQGNGFIACEIRENGQLVAHKVAQGAYSLINCRPSLPYIVRP